MALKPLSHNFSVFEKLEMEEEPVGIKFLFYKPEGVDRLENPRGLCEMFDEAQRHDKPFYMDKNNEDCMGRGALGMLDEEPGYGNAGEIGEHCRVFRDAGANRRCMQNFNNLKPGICHYVVFAKLSKLNFEPDLLMLHGPIEKIGIVLRGLAYSTGCIFESKASSVFQCTWLYSYPYLTGKFNYIVQGIGFGTGARKTYSPGSILLTIPSNWFPVIVENLNEMDFVPRGWDMTRDEWLEDERNMYATLRNEWKEADFS